MTESGRPTLTQSANRRRSGSRRGYRRRTLVINDQTRRAADLFLVSFLILFLELACIRWFGSMVVYLTFFTNIALLAHFSGSRSAVWRPRAGAT
jgi:hypothetical protein